MRQLFQKQNNKKKVTDDEVLTPMLRYRGLVRIMVTCVRQTEKQKDCSADVTRSGGSWKTSFG